MGFFSNSKLFGKCLLVIILCSSDNFPDNAERLPLIKFEISNNLKLYFIFLNLKSMLLKVSEEFQCSL